MKALGLLLGPELYWVLIYLVAVLFARQNLPPTEASSRWLEKVSMLLPLVAVPLSFAVFWLPTRPRWLIARFALALLVGLIFVVIRLVNGVDYGDSRNSGVFGVFALGLGVGFLALVASLIALWILR